ncbi:MAG: hypothetical protein HQL46_12525 [Gammaproteobacteria bacterium]|nr:hypothetical protein [Gammaproteobacteria bacterium]
MNTHECENLPPQGIYIECSDCKAEKKIIWNLYIQREATESDLEENHYLETEGEAIWTTILEITHCPYCGIHLPGLDNIDKKSYGKFTHIDSSGWSSKTM